jgi:NlpC/P60 family putative phage cell wall peptidase
MLADRDQTSVAQACQSEAEAERVSGANIVKIARDWLGTPYRHQASLKGVGCDCLGLVRGVYAEACGRPAESPPPYSRDWAEAARRETLIEAAQRHLTQIDPSAAKPGDVLIFRLRPGAMAKHCGIVSETASGQSLKMIHAVEGAPVCEVNLSSWWLRRIAAAFRFPISL